MKYATEELSSMPDWEIRMVANSKDTAGLLFISGYRENEKDYFIFLHDLYNFNNSSMH